MADRVFEPEVSRSLKALQAMNLGLHPPIAFECKKTESTTLHFDRITEDQLEALIDFKDRGLVRKLVGSQGYKGGSKNNHRFTSGTPFDFIASGRGHAFVLVNFRFTKKAPRKDIPKGTNRCFAVPIDVYRVGLESLRKKGYKSFPYEWFFVNAMECPRIKVDGSYIWDFREVIEFARRYGC